MINDQVMQVVNTDTFEQEEPPGVGPRFDLQPPPFADVFDGPDYANSIVSVEIHSNQRIKGKLIQFNNDSEILSIQESSKAVPTDLDFGSIKFMRLEKPYQLSLDDENPEQTAIPVDGDARGFQVFFKDRTELTGQTYGSRVDKNGIHFYEQQKKGRKWRYCTHLFVTKAAIENHIIGEQLGGLLVRKNAISQIELDSVLKEQQQVRSERLGDFLVNNQVIDGQQLEQALQRQTLMPNVKLGELLVTESLITENQLQEALKTQKQKRKNSLGEILVDRGAIDRDQIQECLAQNLGIPFVNLQKFEIAPEVIKLINADLAYNHKAVPLYEYNGKVAVAMENPMDWQIIDVLSFSLKKQIEPVMSTRDDINWALHFYYPSDDLAESMEAATAKVEGTEDIESYDPSIFSPLEISDVSSTSITRIVNKIIEDAHRQKVTTIHIEPGTEDDKVTVLFRKDGILTVYYKFPSNFRAAFNSRLKIMSRLDVTQKLKPQEGKIIFRNYGPIDLDLQMVTIPTAAGSEDIVIKVLSSSRCMPVNALGLSSSEMDQVLELISKPQGLFIVCGPGGSGKTTTMHSLIHYLNQPDRKVCTVEDPIGVMQRGLRQVEVNEKNGLDFATATQALLRTDPDVIMIGEMREPETATIAIEAVLNGHLLISSLATKTAAEAIQRLRDMGVNSFDIADSLLGVLSQRSLKTLCNSCKKPYTPELKELVLLAQEYVRDFLGGGNEVELDKRMVDRQIRDWEQRLMSQGEFTFYKAPGCKDCMDTGYRGSIGVHQLMVNTSKLKKLILNNSGENELREAGVRSSMRTHKQDGIEKILLGFTDYSQVRTL